MEIFDLKEGHNNNAIDLAKKILFQYLYVDIFSVCYCYNFISGYNNIYVYIMQTHETEISSNQSCFALKEVGMVAKQEHVSIQQNIECNCIIQWYTIFILSINFRHSNFHYSKG